MIWQKIIQIRQQRKKAALCTIVDARGSTPRKAGSKLLVVDDGQFYGTIGGGDLEFNVIEQAKSVIKNAKPVLLEYNLSKDLKMACGGHVKVFIEPILPSDQLILFGAGHVSRAIANLAQHLDFEIIVVDPRKDVIDSWNLVKNTKFVSDSFERAFEQLKFDRQTYICSLAFTHDLDLKIAALALKKEFAYLGVIASKNKARKISKALQEQYGFTQQQIEKIDMPMGIPIKVETPAEIAISVLAKIVDLRNKFKHNDKSINTQRTLQITEYQTNSNQKAD